ncbi:protein of unknown function [Pararobbsia alpina]
MVVAGVMAHSLEQGYGRALLLSHCGWRDLTPVCTGRLTEDTRDDGRRMRDGAGNSFARLISGSQSVGGRTIEMCFGLDFRGLPRQRVDRPPVCFAA